MNVDGSPIGWVAIDFLCCILLVVYTLVAPPPTPASIDTFGQYAVEVSWPPARDDDIDTYVQDPAGNVVSFSNKDVGLMHLEHDDLGTSSDVERNGRSVAVVHENVERVVLRGVLPGEVTVNVHAYEKRSRGPCPVTVVLWRLRGNDKKLLVRHLALRQTGEELTAFRFTLDARGELRGHNELPKKFVGRSSS